MQRTGYKVLAIILMFQFLGWMQLGLSHTLCQCDHFSATSVSGNVRPEVGCCGMPAMPKAGMMEEHHQPATAPVETNSCCDDFIAASPMETTDCCSGQNSHPNTASGDFPHQFCAGACQTTEVQQNSLTYIPPPPPLDISIETILVIILPDKNPHSERERYSRHLFSLSEHSPPKYLLNLALLI